MKIIRAFIVFLLSFSVAFTFFYGRGKIAEEQIDKTPATYKGVISLWQIDSFEGGKGSRKQFLLSVARSFERANQGVLIMVTNRTIEGAKEAIKNGEQPDLISFGIGADVNGMGKIDVDKSSIGGMVGKDLFAVSWCRGGYVLIANPNLVSGFDGVAEFDNLLVSQGEYTQPLTALCLEGYTSKSIEVLDPMSAYVKFTSGKTPYFLATQRDLVRLNNRGMEYISKPLTAYNDLYQYICITSVDNNKRFYAQAFVQHLLSEKIQKTLTDISMFSPYYQLSYENDYYNQMQTQGVFNTISAFTPALKLKEMQGDSALAVAGDKEAINKIKNMLV